MKNRRHMGTKFIEINSRFCEACWKCVGICPNGVLGKIDFFRHRHVKIVHAEACKGCAKCIRECLYGAIIYSRKSGILETDSDKTIRLKQ